MLLTHFNASRIFGTPNERTWPGVTSFPDWNNSFPVWPELSLRSVCPGVDDNALDLLEVHVSILTRCLMF